MTDKSQIEELKEKELKEKELKEKILNLFQELKEEKNGKYAPGSNYKITLPPDGTHYYNVACKLYEYAKELFEVNNTYETNITFLHNIINKEVALVENYRYDYIPKTNNVTPNSLATMEQLMKDATDHIYRDFVSSLMKEEEKIAEGSNYVNGDELLPSSQEY